ncbi:MAG TPA: winged helix-turn-helix domain-containing protein [Steroidobacteraceae bacterium]|nr:winged helix-turn-helix domain-containing protein [Steroidobacteraceae bacterium]
MSKKLIYCFDEYCLDTQTRVLYRGDELVPIEPKLVDMLLYLIERHGSIISKDELLQGLWSGVIVEDSAVRRSISLLRRGLDATNAERYIETAPRQGYRFCSPVTIRSDAHDDVESASDAPATVASSAPVLTARRRLVSAVNPFFVLMIMSISVVAVWLIVQWYSRASDFAAKQLTTNSAELPIIAAAISPDGHMIAFAEEDHLFISNANAVDRHPLPLPKDVIPSYIVWFTDGAHLLISGIDSKTHESQVWSQSVFGGQPDLLIHDARMAAPSPNGGKIVFVRNENQLWMVDRNGMNAIKIASAPDKEVYGLHPQFSNDGQSIIYCRAGRGDYRFSIESKNIVSGVITVLYTSSDSIFDFVLTNPDRLLVAKREHEAEIISVELNARWPGRPKKLGAWPGFTTLTISASSNGRDVIVLNAKSISGIFTADVSEDGNDIANVRRLTLNESPHRPAGWLNDSKTVLFYADREGHYDIFKQGIDEVNAQTMVHDEHDKYFPVMSADQRFLFYFVSDDHVLRLHSPVTMMRVSMDDGTKSVIDTQPDSYRLLRCARQDRCVLAEHAQGQTLFYAFDPVHGKGKALSRIKWVPGMTFCDWDISPDGNFIAFIDTANDPNVIGVIDLRVSPATVARLHVHGQDPLRTISWDAQGAGYYVSAYNSEGDILRYLHISSKGDAHVLHQELNAVDGRMYASPDGRHLAFHKPVAASNIWLLHAQ